MCQWVFVLTIRQARSKRLVKAGARKAFYPVFLTKMVARAIFAFAALANHCE